jgi:amino acid adenylation domain-containing protein
VNGPGSLHLSARKKAVLEALLRAKGVTSNTTAITPRQEQGPALLSFAQQRLWFINQLEPESPAYNISGNVRLHGALDIEALEGAITEIIRRHEALRTTFSFTGVEPLQVVHPPSPARLPIIDVQGSGVEAEIRKLLKQEFETPFDLGSGPLLRVKLIRTAPEEHILLLSMHHIVSDGWSIQVFLRELTALYDAFSRKQPSPLPELKIQYADYAVWQRHWLQGEILEAQLSYWRKQLGGKPDNLELLASDRGRPGRREPAAQYFCEVPGETAALLQQLGRQEDATLFMTALAAFYLLLWRYSGQRDISVGTPVANRNRAETEALIGFFVNMLVMRMQLNPQGSFLELLRQTRETALGAYTHQDVPFEKIVEDLQPERDASRSPLFSVMFALQSAAAAAPQFGNLAAGSMPADSGMPKFDLSATLVESADRLLIAFDYDRDLFHPHAIERMAAHFKVMLERIARNPGEEILHLARLDDASERLVLERYNDTERKYPAQQSMQELFEAQAGREPHAIAIISGDCSVTYGDLDRRANRLAHYLRRLGAGPERCIGICLERSADMVVGLLAILKAGAVYVPLDPLYPKERLSYMMEDSRMKILLSRSELLPRLPEYAEQVVCLDDARDLRAIEQLPDTALETRVDRENAAYVIYTSGSTGKPKGTAIAHGSAIVLLHWAQEIYTLEELKRVLAATSVCFDLSVFELFVPLSWGGAVVMAEDALHLPLLPAADEVTLINTVPSAMMELLRMNGVPPGVAVVNLAGEPLKRTLVEEIYSQTSARKVFNLYGPTEDTTYSTWVCLPRGESGEVSIGKPVANTRVFILDEDLELLPPGVRGELYIAGSGLARGYVNQPAMTAEKFLPDPFSGKPGARMYRTGDLARFGADGQLEFLGRRDQQVKIRGFRIEPGEIETALLRQQDIKDAAVVAHGQGSERRLVAYVVPRDGHERFSKTELRSRLRSVLPEYMAPSVFVLLDRLPLTPNGKIDRRNLPAPEETHQERGDVNGLPRTPVEEMLAGIWADVLKLERAGIHDNFFDSGGHSLLATQIIYRARRAMGVDLPLRALFENPTIAALAKSVEALRAQGTQSQVPPIVPGNRQGKLPLSFAQQRLWFISQMDPGSGGYNIPAVFRLKGNVQLQALQRAVEEIVRRHESLRTRFTSLEEDPAQIVEPGLHLTVDVLDYRGRPEGVREWLRREISRDFDLTKTPLFRAQIARVDEQEWVLLLVMHHIVSDGWSVGVFQRELAILYSAYSRAEASPLPELPVQFGDYALWERGWLQGRILEDQMNYWRKQLEGLEPLDLPMAAVRPATQTYRGAQQTFTIGADVLASLKNLGRREASTLYMVLLAAFQLLLARYTGRDDIAIGSPVSGRQYSELEGLIGFFVNTLVLRTNLSGNPSFTGLLARVRETALSAYAHQNLPFEKIVEELQPVRDLSRTPLFQIMFLLQNEPGSKWELEGLQVQPEALSSEVEKFDMSLGMVEKEGTLHGVIGYRTDLFHGDSIKAMACHLQTLLSSIAAGPGKKILELDYMPPAERRQVIEEWNQTGRVYPQPHTLKQLLEEQARKTPHAPAVAYDGRQLNYAELHQRANQLARLLTHHGAQPESVIGIALDRGLELIVGLVAIVKTGGAYLPLDLEFPPDRLKRIVRDSAPRLVITDQAASSRPGFADVLEGTTVIDLDREHQNLGRQSPEELENKAAESNLAYIIYTSGSTGTPKGVMNTQRGISNRLLWMQQEYQLGEDDRVLQKTPYSFDVSVWEFFLPLMVGAELVVARPGGHRDGGYLADAIEKERITTVHFVPSMLQAFLQEHELETRCASLRRVISSGEALSTELAQRAAQRLGCPIHNLYGPTEAAVDVTYWACGARGGEGAWEPIGRPIANLQMYVLDEGFNPAPVGVEGELYIGGAGLGRGYVSRGDLTAERFLPHPFVRHDQDAGARIYRTGDRGRWNPGGWLEYLGRKDGQVKLRGVRIELGEIEAALLRQPDVREAVVEVRTEAEGEKRLVAYIVANNGVQPSAQKLRDALKKELPEYMAPSLYVPLESLPLTASGKVNRKALPAPSLQSLPRKQDYVQPRNPIESALAGIWTEMLHVKQVGVHDNFFELGGHSLLAARITGKIRESFSVKLPVRAIFERPTIAELALAIEQHPIHASEETAVYEETDEFKPWFLS